MRKILSVALNDLRITFADPSIWIFLVVVPAALIFAVGFANGAGADAAPPAEPPRRLVDVFDADGSAASAALLAALRAADPALALCPMDDDDGELCRLNGDALTPERATARLDDGVTEALIELPAGMGAALLNGQAAEIVYRSDDDPTAPSPTLTALNIAITRVTGAARARDFAEALGETDGGLGEGFAEAVYARAAELWAADPVRVMPVVAEAETQAANNSPGFQQSVPGMGSMYVMFTVFAGAAILIQERKGWTLQRIVTMPVTRGQFLAGKILARVTMGMIQFAVAFAVGALIGLIFGVSYGNSPLALLVMMLAFSLCVSALTLLIATLVDNEQQAAGFTTFLALTLAPIGGAWWSLDFEFIPQFMKDIAVVSPLYWVMDGFNAVIREGGGLAEVLPAAGVLLAIAGAFFALGIARFRAA
jgi:ABC-2 type transport system permease protein